MSLFLPVVTGVAMSAVGVPLVSWLDRTTYRRPDEVDEPAPGRRRWVPPLLGLCAAIVVYRVWQMEDFAWPVAVVLTIALLSLALTCVTMAAIDLDVRRLPDKIMIPAMKALAVALVLAALVGGGWEPLARAFLTGLGAGGLYLALALASMGRGGAPAIGLGDVKLAVLLGAALGWFGWQVAFFGILGGFIVGGLWALVLLAMRRVTRTGSFAYGPAMMLGALLGFDLSA